MIHLFHFVTALFIAAVGGCRVLCDSSSTPTMSTRLDLKFDFDESGFATQDRREDNVVSGGLEY